MGPEILKAIVVLILVKFQNKTGNNYTRNQQKKKPVRVAF
jgi:hypothetical protein